MRQGRHPGRSGAQVLGARQVGRSEEELERRFQALGEKISSARKEYERIKESEAILSAVVEG
ncbi:MAG: hypothetical protein RB148_10825 [Armatimonadota bacterium]|nr:hypothetical protein [Armatimonadota bacterium]